MSHLVDSTYDVYTEREVTARRAHQCSACGERIERGHRYWRVSWVYERSASSVKRCRRCQAIHDHLKERGDGESWPDERLSCGSDYEQEWGDPPPDEIAALAFALPGDPQ